MTNDFAAVSTLVADFQRKLEVLVKRDGSRHMMDAHMPIEVLAVLEDELMPALNAAMTQIEWEPSDEDLLLNEPPITMAEMHSAAHAQHMALHN
jgi:hypothetical protein